MRYGAHGVRRDFIGNFGGSNTGTCICAFVRNKIEASRAIFDQVYARRKRHDNSLAKELMVTIGEADTKNRRGFYWGGRGRVSSYLLYRRKSLATSGRDPFSIFFVYSTNQR